MKFISKIDLTLMARLFFAGYYADIGARCQVFRVCANTAEDISKGFAFLCPNGTLFNQGRLRAIRSIELFSLINCLPIYRVLRM